MGKKVVLFITSFGLGLGVGYLIKSNQKTIEEVIDSEKKVIDKFKKNPKNKGFLNMFKRKK